MSWTHPNLVQFVLSWKSKRYCSQLRHSTNAETNINDIIWSNGRGRWISGNILGKPPDGSWFLWFILNPSLLASSTTLSISLRSLSLLMANSAVSSGHLKSLMFFLQLRLLPCLWCFPLFFLRRDWKSSERGNILVRLLLNLHPFPRFLLTLTDASWHQSSWSRCSSFSPSPISLRILNSYPSLILSKTFS